RHHTQNLESLYRRFGRNRRIRAGRYGSEVFQFGAFWKTPQQLFGLAHEIEPVGAQNVIVVQATLGLKREELTHWNGLASDVSIAPAFLPIHAAESEDEFCLRRSIARGDANDVSIVLHKRQQIDRDRAVSEDRIANL